MSVPIEDKTGLPVAAHFLTIRRRTNPPTWICVYLTLFLIDAIAFAGIVGWSLTRRRTTSKIHNDLAEAAATLTLINFAVICSSIRHADSRRDSVGQLIHESGSCYLFLVSLAHAAIELVRREGNLTSYSTGIVMILVLTIGFVLLSTERVRKYRHGLFRYSHAISFLIWSVVSVVHSVYFLPLVVLTVIVVYGSRLTMRLLIPTVVTIERLSDEFALLDLKLRKSRTTRFLLVDRLTEHNGRAEVWLICRNIGYLERRSFAVIETRHRKRHVYVRLLVAKLDDWTEKLCDLLAANEPYDLFSVGVTVSIDCCRTSTDSYDSRECNRLLFLLRNEEIVWFLRYLVYICDPRNEKRRDRFRQIFLHYSVTDLNYLALLQEYLTIATVYKCITVSTLVYTREPIVFGGTLTSNDSDNELKLENVLRTIGNRETVALVIPDETMRLRIKRFVRRSIVETKRSRTNVVRIL